MVATCSTVAVAALPPTESTVASTGCSVPENTLICVSVSRQSDKTPEKSCSRTAAQPSTPAISMTASASPPAAAEKPRAAAVMMTTTATRARLLTAPCTAPRESDDTFSRSCAKEPASSSAVSGRMPSR